MIVTKQEYWDKIDNITWDKFNLNAYCCICYAPWFFNTLKIVISVAYDKPVYVCANNIYGCTSDDDERFIERGKDK
jgi:hypothetical protein